MARKKLKSWIDDLTCRLGTIDNVSLKGEMVKLSVLAEALENGQSTAEAEAKITTLEATIQALEAQLRDSNTQNEKLQADLDVVRGEIEQLRSDEKAQEKDADLEDGPSAALLTISGFRHGTTSHHLSRGLKIGEQLTIHYLETLVDAGLVQFTPATQKEHTLPNGVRQDYVIPANWQIAKRGRAYLAKRELLN